MFYEYPIFKSLAYKQIRMPVENEPILNLEQAKRFFIKMGCSHFHMVREYPDKYNAYKAFVSDELESKWTKEEFERRVAETLFTPRQEIGEWYHWKIASIIQQDHGDFYLETILKLTADIKEIIPPDQLKYMLSAIVGTDGSPAHGGLIDKSCQLGRLDLAQQYIAYAKHFISQAEESNISFFFKKGYLVDVIEHYGLKESAAYLNQLREEDNIQLFNHYKKGVEDEKTAAFAMWKLGNHYLEGKGCEKNNDLAIFWLTKAADRGHPLAKEDLLSFQSRL